MDSVRTIIQRLFFLSAPCLCLAWLVGWMAKDRTPLTTWFYFIPAAVVVPYALCWYAMAPADRAVRIRTAVKWVGILAAMKIGLADFAWHEEKPVAAGAIRIVHWNVGRWDDRAERQFKAMAADRPEICLLSESPRHVDLNALSRKYFGAPVVVDDAGMTLMTKFPCESLGSIKLINAKGWAVRLSTAKGPLDVIAVDFVSRPSLARLAPMTELAEWIRKRPAPVPLLLLGDFNTPRDSTAFEPLRRLLQSAYEIAGRGWPYSWPVPLCVYSIDHAWVTPSVRVLNYTMKTSLLSDHRRQVMDIEIPKSGPSFLM